MAIHRIVLALVVLSFACGSDDDDADDASIGDAGPDASPGVALCGPLPASCALDCDAEPGAEYCAQQSSPQTPDCTDFCYEGRCCACEDEGGAGPAWSPRAIDCAAPAAECPNYIASDENCGACTKAWGSGGPTGHDAAARQDDPAQPGGAGPRASGEGRPPRQGCIVPVHPT